MIQLSNYETWFLQYADGECSPAEREAVEQFLQLHPSLKEELDLMMQVRLEPEQVSMPGKEWLRFSDHVSLEEAYRLEPDLNIVFPDKKMLYRKERARVVQWFSALSAAAVLFVCLGLYALLGDGSSQQPVIASFPASSQTVDPVKEEKMQEEKMFVTAKVNMKKLLQTSHTSLATATLITEPVPVQLLPDTEMVRETIARAEEMLPVQTERRSISNLSEEVLKAAAARMEAATTSIEPAELNKPVAASLNTAVLLTDAAKPVEKKPLRSLVRTLTRRIIHEDDSNEEGQIIQVANFHFHVKN